LVLVEENDKSVLDFHEGKTLANLGFDVSVCFGTKSLSFGATIFDVLLPVGLSSTAIEITSPAPLCRFLVDMTGKVKIKVTSILQTY